MNEIPGQYRQTGEKRGILEINVKILKCENVKIDMHNCNLPAGRQYPTPELLKPICTFAH